jgi:hypothetical protein
MRKTLPTYNDRQLEAFKVLERNSMARKMFWYILAIFTMMLGLSVYIGVFSSRPWIAVIPGGLDGIVGWSLRAIVVYLFPPPNKIAGDALQRKIEQ